MTTEEAKETLGDPVQTTRTFVDAVIWGDHQTVWELLAAQGRETVLRVAVDHGMDEALASRLREGTAAAAEQSEFLVDLIYGLRNDLHGHDLDDLEYELDPKGPDREGPDREGPEQEGPEPDGPARERPEPGQAKVVLLAPVPIELGPGLPVASAELSHDGERWKVERLVPRKSLSA